MELLFLSFSSLSSTGLSDVVPIKPFARGLVMFEMIAGRRVPDNRLVATRGADGSTPAVIDNLLGAVTSPYSVIEGRAKPA